MDMQFEPEANRLGWADLVAGVLLFAASAAFVFWQNSQVAILWDLGYLLDTSSRMALGQMPYRDFPLVHAPLTFLIQAAIIRLGGRVYLLQVIYAAMVGGAGTVVAWRIVLGILRGAVARPWDVSVILAAPLVFLGVYGVYPHPIYDCDCGFAILVALFFLQRLGAGKPGVVRVWAWPVATGVTIVLPVFFKQNMGAPFLMAVVLGLLLLLAGQRFRGVEERVLESSPLLKALASAGLALAAAALMIQLTAGMGNYLRWTVHFAAERRLPGLADMVGVYRQPALLWMLPAAGLGLGLLRSPFGGKLWGKIAGACLFAAPFAWSLVFLFLNDDLDERADNLLVIWPLLLVVSAILALYELRRGLSLGRLLPFFELAAIHGTFLSQQLWGSTYAIWPLLILLIAQVFTVLPRGWVPRALAGVVSATLLICGGLYAAGHERLNYAQVTEGDLHGASLQALRGMETRGGYVGNFEELVRFTDAHIPRGDALLVLPGEDPFYFATGRVPQFPVTLFDRTTDPYSAQELIAEAGRRDVRWVIVKAQLQSAEDPLPEREETMKLIEKDFNLFQSLSGYDVYRHR